MRQQRQFRPSTVRTDGYRPVRKSETDPARLHAEIARLFKLLRDYKLKRREAETRARAVQADMRRLIEHVEVLRSEIMLLTAQRDARRGKEP